MAPNQTVEKCLFLGMHDVSGKPLIKFTAISTSVFGLLSAIGSVFGNALILYVVARFDRLQTPSNILLCNLCVTDFITGFIVVPTISIRRITEAYGNGICTIRLICAYFAYLTVIMSIVTVCVISVDRYFAIMRPFQYQRMVTVSRYIVTLCILWLILCIYSGLPFLRILSAKLYFEIAFIVMTATTVVFLICYARISTVARSHRRKLQHSIASSRQEAASPTQMPQSTCNMSTNASRFQDRGRKTSGLCPVKLSSVNESSSEQYNLHSPQQECQRNTTINNRDSLMSGIPRQNKVCPMTERFGNTDACIKMTKKNFIHDENQDTTQNQKVARISSIPGENLKSSGSSLNQVGYDTAFKGKELRHSGLESKNNYHNSKHSAVTFDSNTKYNLNRGEHKRANTIAILIFTAVVCYGPLAIIYVLRAIIGDTFEIIYIADPWADLILYLNSTINPIIYCLRGRELRDAIKRVLPKPLLDFFQSMTSCRKSDSQENQCSGLD